MTHPADTPADPSASSSAAVAPRRRAALAALVAASVLAACVGGEGGGRGVGPADVLYVEPGAITLGVGDTARLRPRSARHAESAGPLRYLAPVALVRVDGGGLVHARRPGRGSATVVAPRIGQTFTLPITVKGLEITGARLADDGSGTAVLSSGDSVRLWTRVLFATLPDSTVRWESSDSTVVAVDTNGVLRATGSGLAIVRAVAEADSTVRGVLEVRVAE